MCPPISTRDTRECGRMSNQRHSEKVYVACLRTSVATVASLRPSVCSRHPCVALTARHHRSNIHSCVALTNIHSNIHSCVAAITGLIYTHAWRSPCGISGLAYRGIPATRYHSCSHALLDAETDTHMCVSACLMCNRLVLKPLRPSVSLGGHLLSGEVKARVANTGLELVEV